MVYLNWSKDIVYISTWYIENHLLINYRSFINKWFANPIFLLCYLSITSHLPILCQLITNDLLMQFLCIIIANCLPIICQSALSFYYIPHIVAIATNYSNLLYQCFTNHYQSDPVLYISSLPMIINNLPIHHYQS